MKKVIISLLISGALIGGAFLFVSSGSSDEQGSRENVSIVGGVQYVDIKAKGGYLPKVSLAEAGIKTILRVETTNTFDCSSALVIPSLKYRANLNPSGITEIELVPQEEGSTIRGLCSMGMYGFEVRFGSST